MKMCEARKKADEEAKILKEDAEKARAELEQVKKDSVWIVRVIEGGLSSTQGELESLKASFAKACEEHYDNGYLDYLRNFLATDPEYDWSVKFPPSTPAFMANFQEENVDAIATAKREMAEQFKEEAEKAVVAARVENVDNIENDENTGDASPSQQAAS